MSEKRSFTVVSVVSKSGKKGKQNLGGRFLSRNPISAAKKAFSRICRDSKIKGVCSMNVVLRETTRASNGKEFSYKVNRKYEPRTVVRDGVEVKYKYAIKARKL